MSWLQKLFGDPNKKELAKVAPIVSKIHTLEEEYTSLSDDELKEKYHAYKIEVQEYVKRQQDKVVELELRLDKDEVVASQELKKEIKTRYEQESTKLNALYQEKLDQLLPEVFAIVKSACKRLVGTTYMVRGFEEKWVIVPFDVQLIGGMVMHQGKIAEMRTGEGKTFVATLPVILNALTGRGVHLVTVNDYLAQVGAEWMQPLYHFLGLEVGVIFSGMHTQDKRNAYLADVTYGTNNEFGFDYLRDNMAVDPSMMVQRPLNFAIVDEVDSILIDEARTPLIISAPADASTDKYYQYAKLIKQLEENTHYNIDEKTKTASLSEEGIQKMESLMHVDNIYTEAGFREVHHIEQALKAQACYRRDIDYVVKEGEVVIIDEFTGRMMEGRRYSEGLHQAIEAKEQVEVKRESMTLATITFQNYFRMYNKLAGMTGTAMTEAEEFGKIYSLEVIEIPTNKPIARLDKSDAIFATNKGKYQAIARTVKERSEKGQPVLIGTISIEKSEALSGMLKREGVTHNVLNAKHHEQEAEIVAKAGQKGAVTIATNMAGRGTDIKLGKEVTDLGGLCILGTERHESRRIDNQLRGRAGRQGDPGESQFYVSMDDDLMRIFGGDKMKAVMQTLNVPEDMPIENRIISGQIEQAQKRVEGRHFDIREHVVKYDDVMNKHREIIYARRKRILKHSNLKAEVIQLLKETARHLVLVHTSSPDHDSWNRKEIAETLYTYYHDEQHTIQEADLEPYLDREELIDRAVDYLLKAYDIREESLPAKEIMRKIERSIYLRAVDVLWMEHLENMQYLRQSVAMKGVAQRDPLVEYKQESFVLFEKLLNDININVVQTMFKVDLQMFIPKPQVEVRQAPESTIDEKIDPEKPTVIRVNDDEIEENLYGEDIALAPVQQKQVEAIKRSENIKTIKVNSSEGKSEAGRNEPCPCGSGKKYKKCCGS